MRWWTTWVLSSAIACVLFSVSALAAVSQPPPDNTSLPQPVPTSETELIVARGFAPEAGTLAGLFAARGQTIDPVADATAMPGTFFPRCGGAQLTVEFVLSGGGCEMALAWYNAVEGSPPGTLNEIVPGPHSEMACYDLEFCPQATMSSYAPLQHSWTPYVYTTDICSDPAYTGGAIGFALVANAQECSATKYSQMSANVVCSVCTPMQPWITALIYPMQLTDAYFLAFEDLPMSPEDWQVAPSSGYAADGDFNDFVFQIGGVCHGACTANPGSGGAGGSPAGGGANGGSTSSGASGGSDPSSGGSGDPQGGSSQSSGGSSQSSGGSSQSSGGGVGFAGAPPSGPCTPGEGIACLCPNGTQGAFLCAADGSMFSGCQCTNEKSGCGCSMPTSRAELAGWLAALALAAAGVRRLRRS